MTDAPIALDPEPVKLQLAVNNDGSTTVVNDSMTIDLYETPCDVTTAVFPETIDQTDHTINCITNLADYAVLAKDWLEDYALTQPEPAPTP